jgi:chemotaxis protein CheY-P-specific phosphatase CheC
MEKVTAKSTNLSRKQVEYFDKFLITNSLLVMNGLENIFGLSIDSSDTRIEIASAVVKEHLEHLGSGTVYTMSSDLVGNLSGSVLLIIRAEDFKYLCEMMTPVLNLMFPEGADDGAENSSSPEAPPTGGTGQMSETAIQEHMMETLAEMGNVLIGVCTKAIFKVFQIKVHHSVTQVMKDTNQQSITQLLSSSAGSDKQYVIIENDFIAMEKPIKFWCLTSLVHESFQYILQQIEICEELDEEPGN